MVFEDVSARGSVRTLWRSRYSSDEEEEDEEEEKGENQEGPKVVKLGSKPAVTEKKNDREGMELVKLGGGRVGWVKKAARTE